MRSERKDSKGKHTAHDPLVHLLAKIRLLKRLVDYVKVEWVAQH